MIVNTKEMAGTPVETRSGQHVGKVGSFDLDAMTGHLQAMRVKTRGIVPGLLSDELLVPWNGVLEMSKDKVVIQDGAVAVGSKSFAHVRPTPSPTLMKER